MCKRAGTPPSLDAEEARFISRPFYGWTESSNLGELQGRYGRLPQTELPFLGYAA